MNGAVHIDEMMVALLRGDWSALIESAESDETVVLLREIVLSSDDEIVRQAATGALGALAEIGTSGAVKALIAVLEGQRASYALDIAAFYLLGCGDDRAAQALRRYVGNPHHTAHLPAVRALAEVGDPRAIEPLIAIINNSRQETRHELVRVLGGFDDVRVVFPLLRLLHHEDERVRAAARQGLESVNEKHAFGTLVEYLTHPDAQTRRQAAIALGEIGCKRAIRPLSRLVYKDADPRVAQAFQDALHKLGAVAVGLAQ